jgi:hypothetical protein
MACGSCSGGCGGGREAPAGVVTDVVIADEGEAAAVAQEPAPTGRWPAVDAKGVEQVKLARLWALLAGRDYRDELILEFAPLHEVSEEGPWVFRVPAALAALLADADDARARASAAAWAATEELELDGWEPPEAWSLVDELRKLARSARAAKKPLLMWVSL